MQNCSIFFTSHIPVSSFSHIVILPELSRFGLPSMCFTTEEESPEDRTEALRVVTAARLATQTQNARAFPAAPGARRAPGLCLTCKNLDDRKWRPLETTCPQLQVSAGLGCMICQILHLGLSAHLGQLVALPNKVTITPQIGSTPLKVDFDTAGTPLASEYPERMFQFSSPPGTLV